LDGAQRVHADLVRLLVQAVGYPRYEGLFWSSELACQAALRRSALIQLVQIESSLLLLVLPHRLASPFTWLGLDLELTLYEIPCIPLNDEWVCLYFAVVQHSHHFPQHLVQSLSLGLFEAAHIEFWWRATELLSLNFVAISLEQRLPT